MQVRSAAELRRRLTTSTVPPPVPPAPPMPPIAAGPGPHVGRGPAVTPRGRPTTPMDPARMTPPSTIRQQPSAMTDSHLQSSNAMSSRAVLGGCGILSAQLARPIVVRSLECALQGCHPRWWRRPAQ